jgi:trehalose utilization protein
MGKKINVVVWNEARHEKKSELVRKVYPAGIHGAIAEGLGKHPEIEVKTATLDDPEHGLTEAVLDDTDVLIWWGHGAHREVQDEIVERVRGRILRGMGLIALHSSHMSKIFLRMIGTSGRLRWREAGEKVRLWTIEPGHPIAEGIDGYFELPHDEMYGEPFGIPAPDKVIFISWYPGGEVFRSGCTWERELGRVFYFGPGHETYPIYYDENVVKVLTNAVRWAAPRRKAPPPGLSRAEPLEPLPAKE